MADINRNTILAGLGTLLAAGGITAGVVALTSGGAADAAALQAALAAQWGAVNDRLLPQASALADAVQAVEMARIAEDKAAVAYAAAQDARRDAEAHLAELQAAAPALRDEVVTAVDALSASDVPADIKGSGQLRSLTAALTKPTEARQVEELDPALATQAAAVQAALSVPPPPADLGGGGLKAGTGVVP